MKTIVQWLRACPCDRSKEAADEIERLTAERDALRLDAERYRWLRDESQKKHDFYSDAESWMVSRQQGGMGQNIFGTGIDVAIDVRLAEDIAEHLTTNAGIQARP